MIQQYGCEVWCTYLSSDNGQKDGKKLYVDGRICGNGRQRQTVGDVLLYRLGRTRIADKAVQLVHLAILSVIGVVGGMAIIDIAVTTALLLDETNLLRMMMMGHTRQEQHRERCRPKGEDVESAKHGGESFLGIFSFEISFSNGELVKR